MAENNPSPTSRSFVLNLNNLPGDINAQARIQGDLTNVLRNINIPGIDMHNNHNHDNQHHHHHHHHEETVVTHDHRDSSTSFVVNIGNDGSHSHEHFNHDENQNTSGTPPGGEGSPTPNPLSNIRGAWKLMEKSLPFAVLLLFKLLYNHRLGILVLIGLLFTYLHANTTLKRHISLREQKRYSNRESLPYLLWIVVFLSGNIFFIYYVFDEQKLYNSLIFQLPAYEHIDLWALLWIVGITDYVIKFGAMVLKALVTMLPPMMCPVYKKRGKYYMFIEEVSQFYRCLVPALPWICFLKDAQYGGEWFSIILFIIYFLIKSNVLWGKFLHLRKSYKKFQADVSYGIVPSREELKATGESCAICQDHYKDPVMLSCKHIFCEDCVSMWFDRERTCPMCRANIIDSPQWRDGSTTAHLQLC